MTWKGHRLVDVRADSATAVAEAAIERMAKPDPIDMAKRARPADGVAHFTWRDFDIEVDVT